jgi:hypothetical protein
MKLQLKFKESASPDARQEVLAKLVSRGARQVDPLFPDSPNQHLQLLYVVDADDSRTDLLQLLRREDAVELAEAPPPRRLH